jgi:hypothetical protein
LVAFARLEPRLPHREGHTRFVEQATLDLDPAWSRDQIIHHLEEARHQHRVADLSFYAGRDLARADWAPVLKAALERSPVCIHGAREMADEAVIQHLASWPAESIYDGTRVAQPDEVWNYGRGDGVEKALCLAAIWKARHASAEFHLHITPHHATLSGVHQPVTWASGKGLEADLRF